MVATSLLYQEAIVLLLFFYFYVVATNYHMSHQNGPNFLFRLLQDAYKSIAFEKTLFNQFFTLNLSAKSKKTLLK